ncbi:MAG TPA: hypothetical protein VG537_10590, partial [Candidatus Kapabacteria bacterium]|nr:hypothetical protein [Candidatus Kapabacteria bacterium]
MRRITILLLLFGASGCSYHGELARVSQSKSYSRSNPMTVLMLPCAVECDPDLKSIIVTSDRPSAALLSIGCSVIDDELAANKAKELGIALTPNMSAADVQRLATSLGAQSIFMSTVGYSYVPPTSGTTPASIL